MKKNMRPRPSLGEAYGGGGAGGVHSARHKMATQHRLHHPDRLDQPLRNCHNILDPHFYEILMSRVGGEQCQGKGKPT